MIRPNDTPRSPSTRQRTRSAAAADAAALTQWQHVVDVLEDAARACDARADRGVSSNCAGSSVKGLLGPEVGAGMTRRAR